MAPELDSFAGAVGSHLQDAAYRNEVAEEIYDHLQSAAAALEAAGVESAEARHRAMAAFGDPQSVGGLFTKTRKGERPVKLARFGGVFGSLGVLNLGVYTMVAYAERYDRTSLLLREPLRNILHMSPVVWLPLLHAAAVCVYAQHRGSRLERGGLIAMQAAGGALFLAGVTFERLELFVPGALLPVIGALMASSLHVARREWASLVQGGALVVANLGFFATGPIWGRLSPTMKDIVPGTTAAAWLLVAVTLLLAGWRRANPARRPT